ncbi:ribonuclease H-like domain-containing protein [Tanacetum coccineum]
MIGCNSSRTPIDTTSKLGDDGDLVFDPTLYKSLAGSLQYLTFTRHDISDVVQQVLVAPLLGDRLQAIVSFLATTYSRGPLNVNRRYLVQVPRQSIMVLLMLLLRPAGCGIYYVSCIPLCLPLCLSDVIMLVRVLHVPSRYQYVYIFTKRLPSTLFEEFRTSLSVRCPPAPTAGEC